MFKTPSELLQRDPASTIGASGLGSALPLVGTGVGLLETGIGIVQNIKAKKRINSLLDQEEPFQTSQQIYDLVNATLNNSQGDTATRDYETNEVNQGLSNSVGAAVKLGANPNDLSSLFEQSINGIMRVGEQFHQSNTAAFSNVVNAFKLLADNKDAEYASKQDMLKDRLAAAGANLAAGSANVSGGINTTLSSLSSKATGDLYKQKGQASDMQSILNNILFGTNVKNAVSGNVTDADMMNSMQSNNATA